jgi:hypothetical protein
MNPIAGVALIGAAALVAAAVAVPARAQTIADPTQPPAGYAPKVLSSVEDEAARERPLQMVIRGPGDRRTAVIRGQRVNAGDAITLDGGEARVVQITDDTVVLERGTARETLELLPPMKPAQCAASPC